ncbi:MAG: putative cysteine cluster protein YcgN (CxxCxxCC family), partial [Moritella dasanensis]
MVEKFWQTKTLAKMTDPEWESLCDGCGKCCLHKIIEDESEEIHFTNVACEL